MPAARICPFAGPLPWKHFRPPLGVIGPARQRATPSRPRNVTVRAAVRPLRIARSAESGAEAAALRHLECGSLRETLADPRRVDFALDPVRRPRAPVHREERAARNLATLECRRDSRPASNERAGR